MAAIVSAVVLATAAVGVSSARVRINDSAGPSMGECEVAMVKQLQEKSAFFQQPRRSLCDSEAYGESNWEKLLSKGMERWHPQACEESLAHFKALAQGDEDENEEGKGAWASFRTSVREKFCASIPELEKQMCSCSWSGGTETDYCDSRDAPLCSLCGDGKCVVFFVPQGQNPSATSCGMASAEAGLMALRDKGGRSQLCEMDPLSEKVLQVAFKPVTKSRSGDIYRTLVQSLYYTEGGGVSTSASPGFVTDTGRSGVKITFEDGVKQTVPPQFVTTSMASLCAPMHKVLAEVGPCLEAGWAGAKGRKPSWTSSAQASRVSFAGPPPRQPPPRPRPRCPQPQPADAPTGSPSVTSRRTSPSGIRAPPSSAGGSRKWRRSRTRRSTLCLEGTA
mmetsp:Transcript_40693/g.126840  ORF Transcript_40693/g.126840 Transcript_40693/m.126840 type:complete len:392 (+) Transcript_40693:88-1263(+)